MPTRSKTTRTSSRARKSTRTARARSSTGTKKGALPAVTVAAKQIKDTVKQVRKNRNLKNIGKAAAAVAGVITAGYLLKKR